MSYFAYITSAVSLVIILSRYFSLGSRKCSSGIWYRRPLNAQNDLKQSNHVSLRWHDATWSSSTDKQWAVWRLYLLDRLH